MTPAQAYQVLSQAISSISTNLSNHKTMQMALEVLYVPHKPVAKPEIVKKDFKKKTDPKSAPASL